MTQYKHRPVHQSEDRWRLEVRLKSQQALRQFMEFQGITSAYELARRANLKVGVVGHLVAGRRHSCRPETATAIERALQCPPGFLFEARMSQVASDTRQGHKVAA